MLWPRIHSLCAHCPQQAHLALPLCLLTRQEAGKLSSLRDTIQVVGVFCHSRVSVKAEWPDEQGSRMGFLG